MSESHTDLAIRQTIVAGAVAGDVTVTGIKTRDVLKWVLDIAGADLTSEFSITAANTINNTGGTSSAASQLLVGYISAAAGGGDLNAA